MLETLAVETQAYQPQQRLRKYPGIKVCIPVDEYGAAYLAWFIGKRGRNNFTFINEVIVMVRLKVTRGYVAVIGMCAPEEGHAKESEVSWFHLQDFTDCIIIAADMNGIIR